MCTTRVWVSECVSLCVIPWSFPEAPCTLFQLRTIPHFCGNNKRKTNNNFIWSNDKDPGHSLDITCNALRLTLQHSNNPKQLQFLEDGDEWVCGYLGLNLVPSARSWTPIPVKHPSHRTKASCKTSQLIEKGWYILLNNHLNDLKGFLKAVCVGKQSNNYTPKWNSCKPL